MTSRDETIEIFFARPAQFGSGRYPEGYGSPPFPKGMPTLNEMDKEIILAIIDKYSGGPVGLNTLSVAVNEDPGTIEEVYEPFLIQQGFIQRTPRGREATALAYNRFGRNKFSKNNKSLFE